MLLSIITATFKSDRNIFETADSIIPHLGDRVEWIIKDSSAMADLNLMSSYKLAGARVFFQEDKTLYQGLNQALRHARGTYFLILGAGDSLIKNSIPQILSHLERNEDEDLVDIFFYSMRHREKNSIFYPTPLNLHLGMFCPHPAIIMRTDLASKIGFFDEKYLIASDYDLTLRYLSHYRRYQVSEVVISDFKGGGMSEVKTDETALETLLIKIRNSKFLEELKIISEGSISNN